MRKKTKKKEKPKMSEVCEKITTSNKRRYTAETE